jgi:hypothetical protein
LTLFAQENGTIEGKYNQQYILIEVETAAINASELNFTFSLKAD